MWESFVVGLYIYIFFLSILGGFGLIRQMDSSEGLKLEERGCMLLEREPDIKIRYLEPGDNRDNEEDWFD